MQPTAPKLFVNPGRRHRMKNRAPDWDTVGGVPPPPAGIQTVSHGVDAPDLTNSASPRSA